MRSSASLVISGPPGVGKTTIGWRIFDLCSHLGEGAAFADLDLLGAAWPAPNDDPYQSRLKSANLSAVWTNFQRSGSQRLIVAGVVENRSEREQLERATNGPIVVCRLDAPDDDLVRRLRNRGRETSVNLEKLLVRATQLSAQLATHDVSDFAVSTAGRSVDEVGTEVLERWNDIARL